MFKTQREAAEYAKTIKKVTGKTHLVFRVPKGTQAYAMGYRFATCEEMERQNYERDGAQFVEVAQ